MASTLPFLITLFVFLSFYGSFTLITTLTGFLSGCKLVCFCFKLKGYELFEFLNIFVLKNFVDFSDL